MNAEEYAKANQEMKRSAYTCYNGACNPVSISRTLSESIAAIQQANINPRNVPELKIIAAQLSYLLGLPDVSLSDQYSEALKACNLQ